jgi:elongation factor P hydroxylase
VIVNENKLADFAYWYKAKGRLDRNRRRQPASSCSVAAL